MSGGLLAGYKYSESRWIDALIDYGSLRIGTLDDFRRLEHGQGISDPTEGKKTITLESPGTTRLDPHRSDHIIQKLGSLGGITFAGNAVFENVNFVFHAETPNAFVYCLSTECSTEVMNQLHLANSCAEIFELETFAREVSKALWDLGHRGKVEARPVLYRVRSESFTGDDLGLDPVWIKEPEYSLQKELRIVWDVPPGVEIEPVNITLPKLKRIVRKVAI